MVRATAISKARSNAEATFLIQYQQANSLELKQRLHRRYLSDPESFYSVDDKANVAYERNRDVLKKRLQTRRKQLSSATDPVEQERIQSDIDQITEEIQSLRKPTFVSNFRQQHEMYSNNPAASPSVQTPGGSSILAPYMMGSPAPTPGPTLRPEFLQQLSSPDPQVRQRAFNMMGEAVSAIHNNSQSSRVGNMTLQAFFTVPQQEEAPRQLGAQLEVLATGSRGPSPTTVTGLPSLPAAPEETPGKPSAASTAVKPMSESSVVPFPAAMKPTPAESTNPVVGTASTNSDSMVLDSPPMSQESFPLDDWTNYWKQYKGDSESFFNLWVEKVRKMKDGDAQQALLYRFLSFVFVTDLGGPFAQWIESPPATKEKIWIAKLFKTKLVWMCPKDCRQSLQELFWKEFPTW